MITQFNLRVYGLLFNHQNQVLLADEFCVGRLMTKFPGGGLELGEGLIEGLKREFREELNIEINNIEHFYTTDFFQTSAFKPDSQLISVYYSVRTAKPELIPTVSVPFQGLKQIEDTQVFRWIDVYNLKPEDLTWPVDRHVAGLLKERFTKKKPL